MTQPTRQRRKYPGAKVFASKIGVYCAHTDRWPIKKCRPNPANPNTHPAEQLKLLAHVIQVNGWRNAIVVSERSGMIVKGHARLAAAQILGVDTVPVDRQFYASEEQEWQDLLADNHIAELAEMNQDMLASMLRELQTRGAAMDLTGYDKEELARLLESTPDAISQALSVERVKIEWGKFKMFHCCVGEQIYCLDRVHYLVSYGTMEGKPPIRRKPENSTVFIDSGMLTLSRKIGRKALSQQKAVMEFADKCKGDWVTMMDIPQVEGILADLKMSRAEAYKKHLANAREFAGFTTKRRKVFVIQGQRLADYDRCCRDMAALITPKDVVAIGSIKDRADNPKLVAAITSKVHSHFPKNDIHLFGITSPVAVREAIGYGATSADSSTASTSVARGECLFATKGETAYSVTKKTLGELMGEESLSMNGKLWLALTAFSMAQVEAALAMSMVMEESAIYLGAGIVAKTKTVRGDVPSIATWDPEKETPQRV